MLQIFCSDKKHAVYLIDTLFGVPLYAYYVLELERFKEGEIEGMLMDQPFDFYGPLDSFEKAVKLVQSLCQPDTRVDIEAHIG